VDDDENIIEMETQMLERLGYKVISRTSSLEALEFFRNCHDDFDLVISDLDMPKMAGDKLARNY
jgi:CheY-like chemotaxis protein